MERIYSTGNRTADRLAQMRITGNVIPQIWYKTIRKETGKPNLNAIVILADIVYWYRPVEVRDEGSGALIGYRKRFKGDLLQRSYRQIADQFGISKRDATNAVVELEKLGVVKRVFKTLFADGISIPNVLFLELDADVLERLTYPPELQTAEDAVETEGDIYAREYALVENGAQGQGKAAVPELYQVWQGKEYSAGAAQNGGLYHRNARQVSPEYGRGISQIGDTPPRKMEKPPTGFGDYTENTYKDYNGDYPLCSYQQVLEDFKEQIGYEQLQTDVI